MQINLTPDPSLLAIMVIFLLNYLVVRKFFLQPVNEIIEQREHDVKSAEKLYEDALARFNEAASQMETQLQTARRDAAAVRERRRAEAAAHRNRVVEQTHAEARTVISAADQKLGQDVVAARETIQRDSEQLARIAAERILGRPL